MGPDGRGWHTGLGPVARQGSENGDDADGGAEDAPAEQRSRAGAHQLPQEGPLAAPQQQNHVGPHVVRVFQPEVLLETRYREGVVSTPGPGVKSRPRLDV